jgi:hypothetical protein
MIKNTLTLFRIIMLVSLTMVLIFAGCGGGFRGDSPNAVEIEGPVFGGDSL